jgi:hypothetical protein
LTYVTTSAKLDDAGHRWLAALTMILKLFTGVENQMLRPMA